VTISVFDLEIYTQREYKDGTFQESLECREFTQLEIVENKTTKAGTFECSCINTEYSENEIFSGYSLYWISEDGTLVQEQVHDENSDILMEMILLSESAPLDQNFLVLILAFVIIGVVVIIFYLYKRQTSPSIPSQQSKTISDYSYTKTCPKCGTSIKPFYRFCENCGSKLEK